MEAPAFTVPILNDTQLLRLTSPTSIVRILLMAAIVAAMGFAFPAGAREPQLAPSYSWKIMPPLGLRDPAEIDTLYTNYSLRFVPQTVSPAYAATGNYCAEGYNMVYFDRKPVSDFMFRDAIAHWVPDEDKIRFFNTRIPMTLMGYSFGGGKENGQDDLSLIFSGNANKRLQFGAMLDYLYSKGMYANQAAKDLTWGLSGSYIGERVEAQAYGYHFALTALENGGITDDLYITDPAEVQGGQNSVEAKQIPTRLTAAQNRITGGEFYLNGRYKLGFYEEEQIDDTTTVKHLAPHPRPLLAAGIFIYQSELTAGRVPPALLEVVEMSEKIILQNYINIKINGQVDFELMSKDIFAWQREIYGGFNRADLLGE